MRPLRFAAPPQAQHDFAFQNRRTSFSGAQVQGSESGHAHTRQRQPPGGARTDDAGLAAGVWRFMGVWLGLGLGLGLGLWLGLWLGLGLGREQPRPAIVQSPVISRPPPSRTLPHGRGGGSVAHRSNVLCAEDAGMCPL